MSETTRPQVCVKYGLADRELVDFSDTPAGFVFTTSDGVSMIDVPADTPDFEGKTGLMYLAAPNVAGGYRGDTPVFANLPDFNPPAAADAGDEGDPVDLSALTKEQLVAHGAVQDPPVELVMSMNKTEMLTALADAATAAADAGDEGDES